MRELAASLKNEDSMLVFGRGQNYATALETALKVRFKTSSCSAGLHILLMTLLLANSVLALTLALTPPTDQGGGADPQRGCAGGRNEARHPRPGGRKPAHPCGAPCLHPLL
jgi:hypothetical protein